MDTAVKFMEDRVKDLRRMIEEQETHQIKLGEKLDQSRKSQDDLTEMLNDAVDFLAAAYDSKGGDA